MLLVEGIGGIMTPITKNFFVADMIKEMKLETIIVTRATLGTLNHTVMTVKTCQQYGIPIKGIIVNYFDEHGTPAEKNAPATIYEITGMPILGTVPFVKDYKGLDTMVNVLERVLDWNILIS